jgi:hypothetical protein
MAGTKARRRPEATKTAATRKPPVSNGKHEGTSVVERAAELSEDVLQSLEEGAKAAIEAVRKLVEMVDKALPPHGEGPSRREEMTDSALEVVERLVHTQYDFLRKVVDSAAKSLTRSGDAK